MARTFVIGDIHGRDAMLEALLDHLHLRREDLPIFLGDYIDGGDGPKVVEQVLRLPNRVCLLGNHEYMFLEWLGDEAIIEGLPKEYREARAKDREPTERRVRYWLENPRSGAESTFKGYGYSGFVHRHEFELPERHRRFYQSLELSYSSPGFLMVHATVGSSPEARNARTVEEVLSLSHPIDDLLWNRAPLKELPLETNWDFTVVCGHTIVKEPIVTPTMVLLDTGAKLGQKLSALCLEERRIYFHDGTTMRLED